MGSASGEEARHPYLRRPHRTFVGLSVPVLVSLIAEPVTGLVDTAFVKELGAMPQAALGVATTLLSGIIWIFAFLGVSSQTGVAAAEGAGDSRRSGEIAGLACGVSFLLGLVVAAAFWPLVSTASALMGSEGALIEASAVYLRIRLVAVPAVLVTTTCFGTLRGLQDMRTPLFVAVAVNVLNVGLDALLIFGAGPFPALGLAGAAWASAVSQCLGAVWAILAVTRRTRMRLRATRRRLAALFVIGRNMFLRTGALTLFLVLATRAATELGEQTGAAHQAIRQVWILTAFVLDAFAAAAQSLVAYFVGAGSKASARHVARTATLWSVATGIATAILMMPALGLVQLWLVPEDARGLVPTAWLLCALSQPLNALAFITDGIHWGTGDYAFLRNEVFVATAIGALGLIALEQTGQSSLEGIWAMTAIWAGCRGLLGVLRVWPGIGAAPLRKASLVPPGSES